LTLGTTVFANTLSSKLLSSSLSGTSILGLPDKHPEMTVLNDRPINAEAPAHLLDESLTSGDRFFVRNNGIPPEKSAIDTNKWTLSIEGESVVKSKTYTLNELKNRCSWLCCLDRSTAKRCIG